MSSNWRPSRSLSWRGRSGARGMPPTGRAIAEAGWPCRSPAAPRRLISRQHRLEHDPEDRFAAASVCRREEGFVIQVGVSRSSASCNRCHRVEKSKASTSLRNRWKELIVAARLKPRPSGGGMFLGLHHLVKEDIITPQSLVHAVVIRLLGGHCRAASR